MNTTQTLSKARAKALKALHASRRGKRVRPYMRQREVVLGEVATAVREPLRGVRSIRVLAAHCRVHDRTLRRWLSGEDWPPAVQVHRMAQWIRRFASGLRR